MYKVDPKYFTALFHDDDYYKNNVKFYRANQLVLPNGVHLWICACPETHTSPRGDYVTDSFSVFAEDGAELFSMNSSEYSQFERNLKKSLDLFDYASPSGKVVNADGAKAYRKCIDLIAEPMVRSAAKDPEICQHIPAGIYRDRTNMGEEIFTAYQAIKCEELKNLSPSSNIVGFVDDMKKSVTMMSEAFKELSKPEEKEATSGKDTPEGQKFVR